ncbi:hypothetical protein NMY22_g4410 [Coprinellus aureogranulatus]|nr:hypothetical protein NMY22_g4410 [Coprinellus aureogranulatus]
MTYKCPSKKCQRPYKTEQGYHRHLNECGLYKELYAKKPVREKATVEEPAPAPMVVDDPPEPELAPTRSTRARRFPKKYKDLTTDTKNLPSIIPQSKVITTAPPKSIDAALPTPAAPPPWKGRLRRSPTNKFGLFDVWKEYPGTSPPLSKEGRVGDIPTFGTADDSENDATNKTKADAMDKDLDAEPDDIRDENREYWKGFGPLRKDVAKQSVSSACAPFANSSVFRLVKFFYTTFSDASIKGFNAFVNGVLKAKDFKLSDIPKKFSLQKELKKLDNINTTESPFAYSGVWYESTVSIALPAEGQKVPEIKAPRLNVDGVHHRKLVEVIRSAFTGTDSANYHYTPVKTFWQPTADSKEQRVYGEVYQSDAFWEEHEAIVQSLPVDKRDMPVAVAAMMLSSDSTHLANFGSASLWPCYLYLGNQSKYERGKPSSYAAHHLIYIPTLPKDLQDQYQEAHPGQPASANTITFLKRELIQAVWRLVLDGEFKAAYKDGLVIDCGDGITRRIFPRFFTYSADYPEKVMLSSILFLAKRGCPEDLTEKVYFDELGTTNDLRRRAHLRVDNEARRKRIDKARKYIFDKGKGPAAKNVTNILGENSEAPVRNAFSEFLSPFGFNFFSLFVPDLLHEFELGVWKATFTHLMRILHTCTGNQIQILNKRFREVPTFGRDTIRKFCNNASSMKKMAARDFEDLLQCSLPVFECLLPEPHNKIVLDFLFVLSCWHATAKLRLHTEETVKNLGVLTRAVGMSARKFRAKVCRAYTTRNLPSEEAARGRRKQRAAANKAAAGKAKKNAKKSKGKKASSSEDTEAKPTVADEGKKRLFNLNTFKFHALGHYIKAILNIGTTDSYSTQMGEQEHRRVKRFYVHTNKRRAFARQVARHYRRQALLRGIEHRYNMSKLQDNSVDNGPTVPPSKAEPLRKASPNARYQMSNSDVYPIVVRPWVEKHKDDPALTNFYDDLRSHLLARLLQHEQHYSDAEFTTRQLNRVVMDTKAIYRHKVLRINYTTYDMLRMQDSINPRTEHNDIMVLANESDSVLGFRPHPYWYARVIGIYHIDVSLLDEDCQNIVKEEVRIDFLWVRWFARPKNSIGFEDHRLQQVAFIDTDLENSGAFGFIDPADVIRAVHMIPAFSGGRTGEYMGKSIARHHREKDTDYAYYNVNPFVDRDMFARFSCGGPGHGTPLPYYPIQIPSLFAKLPSQGKRGAPNDDAQSDEDVGRTVEEDKELDTNEFEEYGYNQDTDTDNDDEDDEEVVEEDVQKDPEGGLGPEDEEEVEDQDEIGELGYAAW